MNIQQVVQYLIRWVIHLNRNEHQFKSNMFLLAAATIGCTPLMKLLRSRVEDFAYNHGAAGKVWNVVFYCVLPVVLLLLSTACLVGDSYNPFIYFQF